MTAALRIALADGGAVSAAIAPSGRPHAPAVILGHGAGADMHSAFMRAMQTELSAAGFTTITFNFPYAEARRRLPDRQPVLQACYRAVLDTVARTLAPPWIAIGGKSLGGRVASHLAAEGIPARALVLLGYPLHPAGRPIQLRSAHLPAIRIPTLFIQGTRDALCTLSLLEPVLATLPHTTLYTIPDADHSFHAPRRTGRTDTATWHEIASVVATWLNAL